MSTIEILNNEQATAWCAEHGIHVDTRGRRISLSYPTGESSCLQIGTALEPGRLIALAHSIMLQDLVEPDLQDFAGALVWFRDWDIWNEASEAVGARMLALVRQGLAGEGLPTLHERPAYLFAPQELVDAQTSLTVPLMFQWDAYVVPVSARCIALLSHDAYIRITAYTSAIRSRIAERSRTANWMSEECPPP